MLVSVTMAQADSSTQIQVNQVKDVRLYQGGNVTKIDVPEQRLSLAQECETALRDANAIIKLAVSDETIQTLKHKETVVEIIFHSPRHIKLSGIKKIVDVSGLLIPLSGEFAEDNSGRLLTTVFYALPRDHGLNALLYGAIGYVSGPFSSPPEHQRKLRILAGRVEQ